MSEQYFGPRFRTVFVSKSTLWHKLLDELAYWATKFHKYGFTPDHGSGTAGNLSYRLYDNSNEFIITSAGLKSKEHLCPSDFTHVLTVDLNDMIVYANGISNPSSESLMHYLIYARFSHINAIFHGHWQWLLENYHKCEIHFVNEPFNYGTKELAQQVVDELVLSKSSIIVLNGHGFISIGKTMTDAANNVLEIYFQNNP